MTAAKSKEYSESYIDGLNLVREELIALKKEFEEKRDKKRQEYSKKYHSELAQYDYDPEEIHNAWGMDWINKAQYHKLLLLLKEGPDKLLPEDGVLSYINGLLMTCEKERCIAQKDEKRYLELLSQEMKAERIDWRLHAETYIKGISLVYKKLLQINKKYGQIAAKKHNDMMKREYAALKPYDFDADQIHNAYGYELISLEEHDWLIKLLEQSSAAVLLPEDEAAKYFTYVLSDCIYEKHIVENRNSTMKKREKEKNQYVL